MNKTFIRHYVEMLIAMFAGMAVLGGGVAAAGVEVGPPAVALLWMATTMSVPMVGWMRYRGHGWAASWEMTASMFIPSFAAIGLMGMGAVDEHGAMAIQHVVMLPAMLVAMLLRREEYSAHAIADPHAAGRDDLAPDAEGHIATAA
jgi:flagellar biosynthetic protein FliP